MKHYCAKCDENIHYKRELKSCPICGDAAIQLLDAENEVVAIPVNDWPFWAWSLKWVRTKADKGVGDTAQRLAAMMGGEQFKAFAEKIGLPCGCTERQAEWNRQFSYDKDPDV